MERSDGAVVEANVVQDQYGVAVTVGSSSMVRVERNVVDRALGGVHLHRVDASAVTANRLEGSALPFVLWQGAGNRVLGNVVVDPMPGWGAVILVETRANVLSGNAVEGTGVAFSLWTSEGDTVEGNVVLAGEGALQGLAARDAHALLVKGNRFEGHPEGGVFLQGSSARVEGNRFVGNGNGVGAAAVEAHGAQAQVHNNAFVGNHLGVRELGPGAVDARHNWWGCVQGPKHPACDGAEGDVKVAPWLKAPP